MIDFPYPAIGRQQFSLELTPRSFVKHLAPARTFGFKDQIDHLIDKGLAENKFKPFISEIKSQYKDKDKPDWIDAVSYTHLTLPTKA